MPSPFPGMNPYLEHSGIWPDFHSSFYNIIKERLNTDLPPGFAARVDRYVWIHEPEAEERTRLGKPDVFVSATAGEASGESLAPSLLAPAPVVLPAIRREGNRYLKIVDFMNHRVVTVIEVLSPANKTPGVDRDAYLMKRSEYLATGVNVVEVDLLRAGQRMPLGAPDPPAADYYVFVCRATDLPRAGVWPVSVREALPTIPVPLRPDVVDVPLPLQACFNRAFDAGRYETDFDYNQPPIPPLTEPNATWVRDLLAGPR